MLSQKKKMGASSESNIQSKNLSAAKFSCYCQCAFLSRCVTGPLCPSSLRCRELITHTCMMGQQGSPAQLERLFKPLAERLCLPARLWFRTLVLLPAFVSGYPVDTSRLALLLCGRIDLWSVFEKWLWLCNSGTMSFACAKPKYDLRNEAKYSNPQPVTHFIWTWTTSTSNKW